MPFSNLRRFAAGRSDRREYWACTLILAVTVWWSVKVAFEDRILLWVLPVVLLVVLVAWVIAGARRLHDFGRTGWWYAVPIVAGNLIGLARLMELQPPGWLGASINVVTCLVVGLIPGDRGENRFGPPPSVRGTDLSAFD